MLQIERIFLRVSQQEREMEREKSISILQKSFFIFGFGVRMEMMEIRKRERGDESIELQSRANVMVERHLGTLYQSNEGSILL